MEVAHTCKVYPYSPVLQHAHSTLIVCILRTRIHSAPRRHSLRFAKKPATVHAALAIFSFQGIGFLQAVSFFDAHPAHGKYLALSTGGSDGDGGGRDVISALTFGDDLLPTRRGKGSSALKGKCRRAQDYPNVKRDSSTISGGRLD